MDLIKLSNVSKSFKGISLFSNVNVSFKEGKIYGIKGHNGSGKSVLFKMICGFINPDDGEIVIDSKYMKNDNDFPENFGVIIDRPGFIGSKTGLENLKSLASIKGEISEKEICMAMEAVGLDPSIKQKMRNYSLGMKQKIAVAQSFMENQSVLILDEPFNALDVDSVKKIRNLLLGFKKEGKTIILTSHNQEDLDFLCDEQMRINNYTLESYESTLKI
ncbi:ATP-binding cassette domain-containing protein [Virgibacillus sp. MSJ-26]|uniref:ATP-binding cassette domain-containing protein n=1 Tax=Virgibacillus sp. MSJ-26 TaxID=2841522 RepID=UPI001C0FAA3A|nr:ATP-binding cassette domain-containing protein [Virgibacillus sp. MSJ-26]MBU5468724.1 ATP-binding cassette domain-containing protein [Virgibacillus sp. MSJ-26]